jgi:hypothetical protein
MTQGGSGIEIGIEMSTFTSKSSTRKTYIRSWRESLKRGPQVSGKQGRERERKKERKKERRKEKVDMLEQRRELTRLRKTRHKRMQNFEIFFWGRDFRKIELRSKPPYYYSHLLHPSPAPPCRRASLEELDSLSASLLPLPLTSNDSTSPESP